MVVHILDGVPEHPTGLLLALESSPRTLMQSRKHFPSFGHRHLGGRTGTIAHYLAGLIWPPKRIDRPMGFKASWRASLKRNIPCVLQENDLPAPCG